MSAIYVREELRGEVVLSSICALLVGLAYMVLPDPLHFGPKWLLLAIAVVLLLPLFYSVYVHPLPHRLARYARLTLQYLMAMALVTSIVLLIESLSQESNYKHLLEPAALLWISNILIFAQWYWEIDGGGPLARSRKEGIAVDFQFPQQANGQQWTPGFIDYFFLAFCSSTALSPADTLPLTQRAKLLMMGQATLSLLLIALVISRVVNII